ncbi:putative leader peptide [Streptomyces cellulosae]
MPHDEIGEAPSGARHREVAAVRHVFRSVHLHSRPHIDLQRVAGALCRS